MLQSGVSDTRSCPRRIAKLCNAVMSSFDEDCALVTLRRFITHSRWVWWSGLCRAAWGVPTTCEEATHGWPAPWSAQASCATGKATPGRRLLGQAMVEAA